jgi:hypothetical protein
MKSIKLIVMLAFVSVSFNGFAMDRGALGLGKNISAVFEAYRAIEDCGLIGYSLHNDQGLKIVSHWENMEKVTAFFRSPAHKALKDLFGLSQDLRAIPVKFQREIEVTDEDKPVVVENLLVNGSFIIKIKNYR